MNIDFHYGVIFALSRLAGFAADEAEIIAHSCQYVDDATIAGTLQFAGGERFDRIASSHALSDYENALTAVDRHIWVPYHFLPGGIGQTFEERAVCRANSPIAQDMVRRALQCRDDANGLHRLGITLHTYVDTWAHQNFVGMISDFNRLSELNHTAIDHAGWLAKLGAFAGSEVTHVQSALLGEAFPLGHGSALHYPDWPYAVWSYKNRAGFTIARDNPREFVEASDFAYRALTAYRAQSSDFDAQTALAANVQDALLALFRSNSSDDADLRLAGVASALRTGRIPGLSENLPAYLAKGTGSWKATATGLVGEDDSGTAPQWTTAFEDTDYRKYHDASKDHLYMVIEKLLPEHGLRLV